MSGATNADERYTKPGSMGALYHPSGEAVERDTHGSYSMVLETRKK
jgi:hypothetical protein